MFSYFKNLFHWRRSKKINVYIIIEVRRYDTEQGRFDFEICILSVDKLPEGYFDSSNRHESVDNEWSPETELVLVDGKCDISFAVSGALKPKVDFEEGENVLEYNDAREKCSKRLFLRPTYTEGTDGTAAIKFKVNGKIVHTVYINNVPTERNATPTSKSTVSSAGDSSLQTPDYLQRQDSTTSSKSVTDSWLRRDGNDQILYQRKANTSQKIALGAESQLSAGKQLGSSVREDVKVSEGGADSVNSDLEAKPMLPRPPDHNGESNRRPTVVPPTENQQDMPVPGASACTASTVPKTVQQVPAYANPVSSGNTTLSQASAFNNLSPGVPQASTQSLPSPSASSNASGQATSHCTGSSSLSSADEYNDYDKILCDESLLALASALSPSDASRLIIRLGVPHTEHQIHLKNHPGDVVSGYFESLVHWRRACKSKKEAVEADSKHMFECLLAELDDMGRKDVKRTLKNVLDKGKQLDKKDFRHF